MLPVLLLGRAVIMFPDALAELGADVGLLLATNVESSDFLRGAVRLPPDLTGEQNRSQEH